MLASDVRVDQKRVENEYESLKLIQITCGLLNTDSDTLPGEQEAVLEEMGMAL